MVAKSLLNLEVNSLEVLLIYMLENPLLESFQLSSLPLKLHSGRI